MGGKPTNFPQPDMGGLKNRQISFTGNRQSVEMQLFEWVAAIAKRLGAVRKGPVGPEALLMNSAQESIDVLMRAAPMAAGMRLGAANAKRLVHANFAWNRLPDGHWLISQICFDLVESKAIVEKARQLAYADALRDAADRRALLHVDVRKVAYPVERYALSEYAQHLNNGQILVDDAIEEAARQARVDVAVLENPVTPADMLLDMVSWGASGLKAVAKDGGEEVFKSAERYSNAYENTEIVNTSHDLSKVYRNKEKSGGDKALEIGLGVAGELPMFGPFIKTLAGCFFNAAIASDASRITKARCRLFVFFVAGYIQQLTFTDTGKPSRKIDVKYFNLGMAKAPKGEVGRVKATTALLHYAAEHYTDGGWGGFSHHKEDWEYPDRFIVKWNPGLLGRSLATQLHTLDNLTGGGE